MLLFCLEHLVSIKRVRELRIKIKNEAANFDFITSENQDNPKKKKKDFVYANT